MSKTSPWSRPFRLPDQLRSSGCRLCPLFLFLLAGAVWAHAQDGARSIVQEAQRRSHTQSERYEGTLDIVNSSGKASRKQWRYERIGSHGNSKAVLRFTAPAEVKGVALLIVNHPDRPSDQWMWTPAIERDRRIALQDRGQRFFGTDFSFEDLEERDVDQHDYKMLGEETVDGIACWKIESRPKQTRRSQYDRSTLWIRKDHYIFWRIENYAKDKLIRRAVYSRLENVQGIWTARVIEMSDLTRNSRTTLTLEKLEYNVPVKDDSFTLQALRRES
jgi:outer membrane lipoprotein-sorting protein